MLEQDAGLEAQQALADLGCERVFAEQNSSVGPCKVLGEALEFVRSGDAFVVTKLDRLARSVPHMWEIVQRLQGKGVARVHASILFTPTIGLRAALRPRLSPGLSRVVEAVASPKSAPSLGSQTFMREP